MSALIEFRNVTLAYGRRVALSSVNLVIEQGDFLGVVGPNGSGKTTLLRAMLRIIQPRHGRIMYSDEERIRFGYVPQRYTVDEAYPLSALDVALMGRYGLIGPFHRPRRSDVEKALQCLDLVGIKHLASAAYRELSGGQKQRVLMARALAAEPSILILDEPTTDMDIAAEKTTLELVRQLHDEQYLTVVLVSHTLGLVANYSEKIALVGNSTVKIGLSREVLTSESLGSLYAASVDVVEVDGRLMVL